jgi:ABC-2 type transport system permease protein
MELVRPINLYSIWHAKTLGKKVAASLLRLIPIVIICSLPFLGQYKLMAPVNASAFILFLITLILSVILMMSNLLIMYIVIMKNMSSKGIRSAFRIVIEFLSGGDIPLAFMPELMIKIIKFTPFYYMQNVPFNIYNGYISNTNEIIEIIFIQIIWIIVLTFIGKISMSKQLKTIVVQGG